MDRYTLHLGDCLETLRAMPACSVDSVVTDPPYGLSFMGKRWDYDVPSVDIWAECLRVLKPGGHLLAFAGTRTQHRMAVRIEDAGFEIRDMIAWVYGSGFPKSLDVSKAIAGRANPALLGPDGDPAWCEECGESHATEDLEHAIYCAECAGREWSGWGTALKPALEPITVARKPIAGTVAANVLAHGAGALNIDACRVHSGDSQGYAYTLQRMAPGADQNRTGKTHQEGVAFEGHTKDGRWPANLIHDGSDEVVALFPQEVTKSSGGKGAASGLIDNAGIYGRFSGDNKGASAGGLGDSGTPARFFYCAKTSRKDRNEGLQDPGPQLQRGATLRQVENAATTANTHLTVKPTDLMAYLCRLVTPPGGIVLDPFMGSGSTGKAAMREGFRFIGCELDAAYLEIAKSRIVHEASRMRAAELAPASTQLEIFA